MRATIIFSPFYLFAFFPLNLTITKQCFIVCVCDEEQQLWLNKQLYHFFTPRSSSVLPSLVLVLPPAFESTRSKHFQTTFKAFVMHVTQIQIKKQLNDKLGQDVLLPKNVDLNFLNIEKTLFSACVCMFTTRPLPHRTKTQRLDL